MTSQVDESGPQTDSRSGAVLRVTDLHAGYGSVTVLRDVHLEVSQGEIVALLGPNGAGKTTLLLACSGLVSVSAGDIRVAGHSVVGLNAHRIARRGVAHVPEDRSLWASLTVDEHLRLTSKPGALEPYQLFPQLGELRNKRAGVLSGGEQQMLALARALVTNPDLLLVDEMSLGLAPVVVDRLFATLREISADRGIGILLVEQHVRLALQYAQRGYVLAGGRIRASDTAAELTGRWKDIQASYLGAS